MVRIEASAAGIQQWLDGAIDHERSGTFRSIRLERIAAFLRRLPAPPRPLTVGGTKGKGSTVRFCEAALRAHDIPTLAFTSPHVNSVLERWRVDGDVVSISRCAEACNQVATLEDPTEPLTYFEKTFAVACILASARAGTVFLCEVGLGGRLDCANSLDCAVAVITHLSHDHRDVLGPTLRDIAREKLAIARPGQPLVIAPQSIAAADAIEQTLPPGIQAIWVESPREQRPLALLGDHQQDNAATAWQALALLRPDLDPVRAWAGMAHTRLAARCQLVTSGGRRLLIDGAHNGPSVATTLAVAASALRPGFAILLGLARDKEVDEVIDAIPPGIPLARCGYRSPRARNQEDWPARVAESPWFPSIDQALAAYPAVDLCITGSFYLAGEALGATGAQGSLPG